MGTSQGERDRAVERQAQRVYDVSRQERHDGSRVGEHVQLNATNPGAVQVTSFGENAVPLTLRGGIAPRAAWRGRSPTARRRWRGVGNVEV